MFTAFLSVSLIVICALAIVWARRSRKSFTQGVVEKEKKLQQALAERDFDRAHVLVSALLKAQPKNLRHKLQLLEVLRGTQQSERALVVLEELQGQYKDSRSLAQEHARLLLDLDRPQEAIGCLTSLAKENNLRLIEKRLLCEAYFKAGFYDKCLYLALDDLAADEDRSFLAMAADCHYERREWKAALNCYKQCIGLGLKNARILNRCASCYLHLQEAGKSIPYLRCVLKHDSDNLCALLGLGRCLEKNKYYGAALHVYQSSPLWKQERPELMQAAGCCLLRMGLVGQACSLLQLAYEAGMRSMRLLGYLGYCLEKLKRFSDAESVYIELVHKEKHHVTGYLACARLYGAGLASKISDEQGLLMARHALRLQPSDVSWDILSACEARAGNFERAYKIQEQLAARDKDRVSRLRHLQSMRSLRLKKPLDSHALQGVQQVA